MGSIPARFRLTTPNEVVNIENEAGHLTESAATVIVLRICIQDTS